MRAPDISAGGTSSVSVGQPLYYSYISTVTNSVNSAYVKTKGSSPTWSNRPSQGGLIKIASMTEINTIGTAANAALRTGCNANDTTVYASNKSNCNNCGFNSAHADAAFTNNKCGGELIIWLGLL